MRSFLFFCLILADVVPGRQVAAQASVARDSLVYVAVLDSMFARSSARSIRQLVVHDTTYVLRPSGAVGRWLIDRLYQLPRADSPTVHNFLDRNSRRRPIPDVGMVTPTVRVHLISEAVRMSYERGDDYWSGLTDAFPESTGLITLSSIGFSEAGDVAILMVQQECGESAAGYHVELLRRGDKWRISTIQRLYASALRFKWR